MEVNAYICGKYRNMEEVYYPRIADELLAKKLRSSGAVLITGCKWCGKTMTASQKAKSRLFMQNPDLGPQYLLTADIKPSVLLEGETPRLIDEWQMAPVLWDAVRFMVDERRSKGQFILTGSAVPKDNVTAHTGTGRISRLMMRPMSLFESKDSNGEISLGDLFEGKTGMTGHSELTIKKIAYLICRGGWPGALDMDSEDALETSRNYVDAIVSEDISRVDGIDRNPKRVEAILKSLARNIATIATNTTVLGDVIGNDLSMSMTTLDEYLNALRRIFVIEDQPAWSPSLRSKTAIRTSDKRHFVDPSIATAILGISPARLLEDFNTFGFLFESLCTRDMRIYAQANDGRVFHYRDKNGLEADIIIELRDGRWGAVEVKMGNKQIEEAAENLKKLASKVDIEKNGSPSFLMVITGGEYAYQRADGVWNVPVGCLRP